MALIQTCQIQNIMTVPESLSFSAQLTKRNVGHVGTEWHTLAHVGIQLSLPFIHYIHWENSFSGSIRFFSFENSPWASLGRILVRNHRKHSCPQRHASVGKLSLGKPATITFGKNKDVNSSIKFRLQTV